MLKFSKRNGFQSTLIWKKNLRLYTVTRWNHRCNGGGGGGENTESLNINITFKLSKRVNRRRVPMALQRSFTSIVSGHRLPSRRSQTLIGGTQCWKCREAGLVNIIVTVFTAIFIAQRPRFLSFFRSPHRDGRLTRTNV